MISFFGNFTIPACGLLINLAFTVSLFLLILLTEYSVTSLVSGSIVVTKICDVKPLGLYGLRPKYSDNNLTSSMFNTLITDSGSYSFLALGNMLGYLISHSGKFLLMINSLDCQGTSPKWLLSA